MALPNRNLKENRIKERETWIKYDLEKGFERIDYLNAIILINRTPDQKGKYYLKAYTGTRSNHDFYYSFRTLERLNEYFEKYKKDLESRKEYEEKRKKEGKNKSSQAQAAAAIRKDLKKHFPTVKFSVTSEGFSMGDAVRVSWVNGCTENQVKEIISKYQYGHFDGMQDMYISSNRIEGLPQTKYLSTTRTISDDIKEPFMDLLRSVEWGNEPPHNWEYTTAMRFFAKTEIPTNGQNIKVVKNPNIKSGAADEDLYLLSYDLPQGEKAQLKAEQKQEIETKKGEVKILKYSKKSIAVIGDTKPIKDTLKSLGGKFNPRLTCGSGWVFPLAKLDELTEALTKDTPTESKRQKLGEIFTTEEETTTQDPKPQETSENEPKKEICAPCLNPFKAEKEPTQKEESKKTAFMQVVRDVKTSLNGQTMLF